MGWYHVEYSGTGIYTHDIVQKPFCYDFIDPVKLRDYAINKCPILAQKAIDQMDTETILVYLSAAGDKRHCLSFYPYVNNTTYYGEDIMKLEPIQIRNCLHELEQEDTSQLLSLKTVILKELFAFIYGYPGEGFIAGSDYDGNHMFFCNVSVPFKKEFEVFNTLTESHFAECLKELIFNLTGENVDIVLEKCKYYEKW